MKFALYCHIWEQTLADRPRGWTRTDTGVRGKITEWELLVLCCCETNYQKLLSLRQHIYYLPVPLGQESRHCLPESSVQGLTGHQAINQAVFHSGAWGPLQNSYGCWQNSVSCSYRTEAPIFSLAVSWGSLSVPRGGPQFLSTWSTPLNMAAHFFKVCRSSCSSLLKLYNVTYPWRGLHDGIMHWGSP